MTNLYKSDQKKIVGFGDQVKFIASLAPDDLTEWVKAALSGDTRPLWPGRKEVDELVFDIFRKLPADAQQRLKFSLFTLLNIDSKEIIFLLSDTQSRIFLNDLFYLAANTGLNEIYDQILSWVKEGILVEQFAHKYQKSLGQDLHLNALRTLAALAPNDDPNLLSICESNIKDHRYPQYFGICYRMLWERDFNFLINYFINFIEYCMQGYYIFSNDFYFMYNRWHNKLDKAINILLDNLPIIMQIFLIISLGRLRFDLNYQLSSFVCREINAQENIIKYNFLEYLRNYLPDNAITMSTIFNHVNMEIGLLYQNRWELYLREGGSELELHSFLLHINGYSVKHPLAGHGRDNLIKLLKDYDDLIGQMANKAIFELKTHPEELQEYCNV